MPNRLAQETSPYLQQHAGNPVDWHAWGEEALARAREEDKPILLSVGYSACHWCHVMAHESFEDPAVAEVMNRLFVNVKVDREERPDLDQVYQLAHQMLAQRPGGWPLTMFLTPDGAPFFGGTYFPKEPRYNLPGFPQLLERVAQLYRDHREEIGRQNDTLLATFERMHPGAPAHHSEQTAAWAMREMQSPEGGYYSSLDADSEHEEGKFYVWTPGEAQALVSRDEYAVLAPHYGLDGTPNFENTHWHLNVAHPLGAVAEQLGKSEDDCARLLVSGRKKLFAAR